MEHIAKDKFLQLVKDKKQMKSENAERSGSHGESIKEASENENLNKTAFKIACQLNEISEGKRDDVIRSLMVYFGYLNIMPGEDLVDLAEADDAPRTSSETSQPLRAVN